VGVGVSRDEQRQQNMQREAPLTLLRLHVTLLVAFVHYAFFLTFCETASVALCCSLPSMAHQCKRRPSPGAARKEEEAERGELTSGQVRNVAKREPLQAA
jgi:hypothetical protein